MASTARVELSQSRIVNVLISLPAEVIEALEDATSADVVRLVIAGNGVVNKTLTFRDVDRLQGMRR